MSSDALMVLVIQEQDAARSATSANNSGSSGAFTAALWPRGGSALGGAPPRGGGSSAADMLRGAATSEPSHSARASLEVHHPPPASQLDARRKSVSFEDECRPAPPPAEASPFSGFSRAAPGWGGVEGYSPPLGAAVSAFSAPQRSLDAAASAAMAALAAVDAARPASAAAGPRRSTDSAGSGGSGRRTGLSVAQHLAQMQAAEAAEAPAAAPTAALGLAGARSSPAALAAAAAARGGGSASSSQRTSLQEDEQEVGAVLAGPELAAFLQDAFGAHLAPPRAAAAASGGGSSAGKPPSRGSLEILLGTPSPGSSSRHSLDSLQELLDAGHRCGHAGALAGLRSAGNVAALLRGSGYTASRQSLDPESMGLDRRSVAGGGKGGGKGSMGDLGGAGGGAVAAAVARPAAGGAAGGGGVSASACASSVVDRYSPGSTPPRPSTLLPEAPPPAMMDADVHDTFGAHVWYAGPSLGLGTAPPPNAAAAATQAHAQAQAQAALRPASSPPAASPRAAAGAAGAPPPPPPAVPVGGTAAQATAKLLEPTAVHGQHSVTLHDAQCTVPSYDFLRQRQLARARQASEGAATWGGGYIAEAKRVLSEAMSQASKDEADICDTSYSGAIGPLMRHLRLHSADEVRARAGLHTLSLLVSNQPNRSIIAELAGQAALAGVLRACPALDVREQCVQLMWDLDGAGGAGAAPALAPPDLAALLGVLRDTGSAAVASHALHFLRAALELPPGGGRPALAPDEAGAAAAALVREACAHVHHLQDAAQYSLGAALGAVLVDPGVGDGGVRQALAALLAALRARPDGAQCQVLLTVLSCLAGRPPLRAALAAGGARRTLLQFSQHARDSRLQARALSLVKVLNKEETAAGVGATWYFGPDDEPHA